MGSTHRAHCICGFQAEVTVGGGGRTFDDESKFPYLCETCGLVSVNIAKLVPGDSPPCPKCGGSNVCQYGKSPVSIPYIELPPPGFMSLFANQLAEWASRVGIKLPFGTVRETRKPTRRQVTTSADKNCKAFQWGEYTAFSQDNRCPACHQMTLIFERMPSVLFD
jgi:hypothetical protein